MWSIGIFLVIFATSASSQPLAPGMVVSSYTKDLPPDFLKTKDLIEKEGFKAETHKVVTEDGYRLQLTRILTDRPEPGTPVLFVHGALAASDSWLLRGRGKDFPYILADQGFDVWLGDARGNYYSREHETMSPKNEKFWNFSFHECGLYDIPEFIDRILKETGQSKLFYVGHSMGTTSFIVMTSLKPKYNDKVIAAALMSTAVFPEPCPKSRATRFQKTLSTRFDEIVKSMKSAGFYEFQPRSTPMTQIMRATCGNRNSFCMDMIANFDGEHRTNYDPEALEKSVSYVPAGTSIKTIHHLFQIKKRGFKYYDYGPVENVNYYGSETPPMYPLDKITTPMLFAYGANDKVVCPESIEATAKLTKAELYKIPDPDFNHMDFIIGMNTKEVLYDKIIEYFRSFMQ